MEDLFKFAKTLLDFDIQNLDPVDKVNTWHKENNALIISLQTRKGKQVCIKIEAIGPKTIRFQMYPGKKIPLHNTFMIQQAKKNKVITKVTKKDGKIFFKTDKIEVKLEREPYNISIKNIGEKFPIFIENNYDKGHPASEHYFSPPLSFIEMEDGEFKFFNSFCIRPDEHFFGLGEKFAPIDRRGHEVYVALKHPGSGCNSEYSFKPIAFFMSTSGYGIFVNTYRPVAFSFGKRSSSAVTLALQDYLLDYYIFLGKSLKEILYLYTEITGKSPLPPKWSFGIQMSRDSYRSQKEVEEVALLLRKKKLPCDIIRIDPGWMLVDDRIPYYSSNQYGCYWECTLEWNKHFPEPEKMLTNLRKLGFKVCLWEIPLLKLNSRLYKEAEKNGYFVKNSDGTTYLQKSYESLGGFVDFTNPDAVCWFKEKHKKLLAQGVSYFIADSGEGGPIDGIYYNMDGKDVKQIYSLLYNKTLFEAVKEFSGEGFVGASTGFAGIQRYPIVYGGDPRALFEDLASSIRGGLSLGLSGVPFWTIDIGGWWFPLDEELYIRMMQVGIFCSHTIFHGNTPREPWNFGERAVNLYRKYAKIRYKLLPYLYSQAYLATKNGLPIMRALVLEFQNDPATYCIDDEFMFGDSFLVAPIFSRKNIRSIYLPKDVWYDFWNKKVLHGPCTIKYIAPLSIIPLFIRGDTIIPMGPELNYVDEKPLNPLYLEIYKGNGNPKGFLYDNGKEYIFQLKHISDGFELKLPKPNQNYQIKIYGLSIPKKILKFSKEFGFINIKRSLQYKEFIKENEGWFFRDNSIFIKIKKHISPVSIILKGASKRILNE